MFGDGWPEEVGLVAVVRVAYRFALAPSRAQERALRSHAGAARFAWNWGLARCQQRYAAERRWYSAAELHKLWNMEKKTDPALGWWAENSKCAYQEAFRNLDGALRDFTRSRKGERKGKRLGFPRFKKRGKCKDSFRLNGTLRCSGATVTLPRLGMIATCEPTVKLAGRLGDGSAGLVCDGVAGRAALVRCVHRRGKPAGAGAACPPGQRGWGRPGHQGAADRRGRTRDRDHRPRPAAAAGRDALHKATTMLAARYETVVAEDLNVAGMTRNRTLARAITDQGFGTVRRMLAYKTTWNGGTMVLAGRWYPSSKTCSGCGAVKAKLALSERTYTCAACGLVMDRDVNAARNLLNLAASGAESLNAREGTVRPRLARRVPSNLEPGTPLGGKTGTAAPQGTAAA
jgi:putative transposase